MVGGQQKNKTRQDNSVELVASLAPAKAEVGAVAKADQYQHQYNINIDWPWG